MASPSSVLTMGLGAWGSVNLIPTLGYGISNAIEGPYCVAAQDIFTAGQVMGEVFTAGQVEGGIFTAGAEAAQTCCQD